MLKVLDTEENGLSKFESYLKCVLQKDVTDILYSLKFNNPPSQSSLATFTTENAKILSDHSNHYVFYSHQVPSAMALIFMTSYEHEPIRIALEALLLSSESYQFFTSVRMALTVLLYYLTDHHLSTVTLNIHQFRQSYDSVVALLQPFYEQWLSKKAETKQAPSRNLRELIETIVKTRIPVRLIPCPSEYSAKRASAQLTKADASPLGVPNSLPYPGSFHLNTEQKSSSHAAGSSHTSHSGGVPPVGIKTPRLIIGSSLDRGPTAISPSALQQTSSSQE